jgi:hypothetical protein
MQKTGRPFRIPRSRECRGFRSGKEGRIGQRGIRPAPDGRKEETVRSKTFIAGIVLALLLAACGRKSTATPTATAHSDADGDKHPHADGIHTLPGLSLLGEQRHFAVRSGSLFLRPSGY